MTILHLLCLKMCTAGVTLIPLQKMNFDKLRLFLV